MKARHNIETVQLVHWMEVVTLYVKAVSMDLFMRILMMYCNVFQSVHQDIMEKRPLYQEEWLILRIVIVRI